MSAEFGARLREERSKTGLNQQDFARAGGVSRNSQGEYELGKTAPNSDYLAAIAAVGVDVAYILTGVRTCDSLSRDESELIRAFRELNDARKEGLLAFMSGIPPFHLPATRDHRRHTLQDETVPYNHRQDRTR